MAKRKAPGWHISISAKEHISNAALGWRAEAGATIEIENRPELKSAVRQVPQAPNPSWAFVGHWGVRPWQVTPAALPTN
jgi:hypothetical protein